MARPIAALTTIATLAFALAVGAPHPVAAQSGDDLDQQLADRFAPVVVVLEQSGECDTDGEAFFPADVDVVLDNPQVALRQVGMQNPVVMWAPGADDLAGLGEGFFLDFPGSALEPGCIYERDFRTYTDGLAPTVYAHLVQPPGEPDLLVLQYWLYWYYNDWNNKHESDWEGIALLFEASSVAEALESEPVAVGYAQHEGGERADWTDDKLERDGDRPVVYSSVGSHASYFDSAVYLGRGATEGFGCDDTSGPSERLSTRAVVVGDDTPWLAFEGRWGERQGGPFNGPTGPALKERWSDPMPWFDGLRDSSVVIPAGDTAAAALVDGFCDTVEAGSRALITFRVSPTSVLLVGAIVVLLARFVRSRTDWSVVPLTPLRQRRRAGQIVRTTIRTYARRPLPFAMIGLLYLPLAVLAAVAFAVLESLPFVGPLVELLRGETGVNLVSALFVGGLTNLAASIVINAIVARHLADHPASGSPSAPIASTRVVGKHAGALLSAFGRSFVIVAVLFLSIVGIPWGVRQLVRYQFVPQAVVLDGRDDALRRSSELVAGRWWHTFAFVALVNLATGSIATVVALLLLVVATGIPLWAFSFLVSIVYALTLPLAAISMTLLHADAVVATEAAEGDTDVLDATPATL